MGLLTLPATRQLASDSLANEICQIFLCSLNGAVAHVCSQSMPVVMIKHSRTRNAF